MHAWHNMHMHSMQWLSMNMMKIQMKTIIYNLVFGAWARDSWSAYESFVFIHVELACVWAPCIVSDWRGSKITIIRTKIYMYIYIYTMDYNFIIESLNRVGKLLKIHAKPMSNISWRCYYLAWVEECCCFFLCGKKHEMKGESWFITCAHDEVYFDTRKCFYEILFILYRRSNKNIYRETKTPSHPGIRDSKRINIHRG